MQPKAHDVLSAVDVIVDLEALDGRYKRMAIDWAMKLGDEVTPGLIAILDKVLADPQHFADHHKYWGHIYSVMLLGHFGTTEAHETIIHLLSLPGDLPYDLFSDVLTEYMPAILLRTCGGSISAIKQLVENKDASYSSRMAAAQALTYAVVAGITSRDKALSILGTNFRADPNDADIRAEMAIHIAELYPGEWIDEIRRAFQDDTIDSFLVGPETFDEALERGVEGCLADLTARLKAASLDDLHAQMSWWAWPQSSPGPNDGDAAPIRSAPVKAQKLGRNDPCHCGSGKKYKKCCDR